MPYRGFRRRPTQQFSITLPHEMAAAVKAKLAGGEYSTESEVIREGLRSLIAQYRAIETWLRKQVVPAAIALEANSSRVLTSAQVREHLSEKRRTRAGEA